MLKDARAVAGFAAVNVYLTFLLLPLGSKGIALRIRRIRSSKASDGRSLLQVIQISSGPPARFWTNAHTFL